MPRIVVQVGGFILYCLALTISATGSKIAFDVVQDTEAYQKIQPQMVEATDQFVNLVVEHIKEIADVRDGSEEMTIHVEVVGDRLRIVVHPGRRQFEVTTLG